MDELLRIGFGLHPGENHYYNSSFEVGDADTSIMEGGLPPTIPDYTNAGLQYKVLVHTYITLHSMDPKLVK
jgi:hypothetical protein